MLLHRFGEHGLATFNRPAVTQAQGMGTQAQLLGQHQVFQAQLADRLTGGVTEHALGAGVEGADHTLEVGGDDRHLGCGIQHAAQLVVGATQGLLADPQLGGALLDQGQGALALAEQAVEQDTEQQAQQAAQQAHRQHCGGTVGAHEGQARPDTQLEVVISQVQQLVGSQRQGCDRVLRIEHHLGAM